LSSARAASQSFEPGQEVGVWHLVVVVDGWSTEKKLMDPLPAFQMGDQDASHPREYANDITSPNAQTKIEFDPANEYIVGLGDAPAETNPGAFIDYVTLSQISDQKIHYHARNHGGRCVVSLLIYKRAQIKISRDTNTSTWTMGGTFVVFVPQEAVDATVIGKMGNDDIFFTPSNPLSGDDAKRFKLVDTKVVDGVGTYYSFKVINPAPSLQPSPTQSAGG